MVEQLAIDVDATEEPATTWRGASQEPPAGEPDWNVAPSKHARVVVTRPRDEGSDTERSLRLLRWGLVPGWAKDPAIGMRMINARSETALTKPAFAKAARARRALVPVDGWYEWQRSPVATVSKGTPRKQPFFMYRADGAPLTFAGLYEFWRDPAAPQGDPGAWLATFTILTQAAEPGLDRIHDRQPVVLEPESWERWLDPFLETPEEIESFLQPHPPGRFEAHPVGLSVGNSRNNGASLVTPVGEDCLVGVVDPATGEIIG